MLPRSLPGLLPRRLFSVSARMASNTPLEDVMRDKVSHASVLLTAIANISFLFFYRSLTHSHLRNSRSGMTLTSMRTTLQWKGQCQRRRISSSFPHIRPQCTSECLISRSVTIVSDSFESKMQPARHRMVYALLKEEMAREGGLHALQLKTKTPAEEQREKERKDMERKDKA